MTSLPAPVGGLNALDSLANMPITDASIMENMFPSTTSVDLRNGMEEWQSGIGAWVETLMEYNGLATQKLFAAAGTSFYDVTTQGGSPSAVKTGLSNARWQYTNVGISSGQYIYAVNGVDNAQLYNGTSWAAITGVSSPIALTGVSTALLINVCVHKQRLWFIQKDSCIVWYLAAGAIGGALTSIDMTQLFSLGGYLVAQMSWTVDNVAGVNDYAAFITSEGEVAVYQGADPSAAATWALVAKFRIGRPIGSKCWVKAGGDAYIICADGVFPLSKALMSQRADLREAISYKIQNLVNSDIRNFNGNYGWQIVLHPIGQKLIVNVPYRENQEQYQYVMNTITKAWTKFTAWNAASWAVQRDNLFFGGNGAVYRADYGQNDDDSPIMAKVRQAFNYFDSPGVNKMWTMIRPIFLTAGSLNPVISLNVDFQQTLPNSTPTYSNSGSPWDTSPWDTSPWSSPYSIQANWQTASGIGKCAAVYMSIAAQDQTVQWQATDFVYQKGGVL